MQDIIKKREDFARFFRTPNIFSAEIKEGVFCLEEEFRWRKYISIESLFIKTTEAIIACQSKSECIKTLISNSDEVMGCLKNELNKFTAGDSGQIEDFIKNGCYKKCISHGDVFRLNVIYDGDDVCFIDFEAEGQRVFFHDIFSFIYSEMYFYNNDRLFVKYMAGKFDDLFERLFDANGLHFKPLNRRLYFYIALFEKYGGVIPDNVCSLINSKLEIVSK